MTATTPAPDDDIAAVKQRTLDAIYRTLGNVAAAIGRDYEECGKAACARSRRCRGTACERLAMHDEA